MTTAALTSYDLNAPGHDYGDFIQRIKSLDTWWHHFDSTWIVKTSQSSKSVRDSLRSLLDVDDEPLIVDITSTSAAWQGFNHRGSKCPKDNVWS